MAASRSGSTPAGPTLVVTGRSARAQRALRGGRPVVRAVLMTTAVAWSLGAVRIPEPEANPAAPMVSVSVGETGGGRRLA